MRFKFSITLTKYKGELLSNPCLIECTMQKLVGDCSGYSVGMVGTSNIDAAYSHPNIMHKLLVHMIVNNRHFLYGNTCETWCNKYVFSGPTETFDEDYDSFSSLYHTFLGMTKHKEQAITTRGWHGKDYDIRTVTIPKSYKHHIPLEGIEWEGIEVSLQVYVYKKLLTGDMDKTIRSLDAEIKRHAW